MFGMRGVDDFWAVWEFTCLRHVWTFGLAVRVSVRQKAVPEPEDAPVDRFGEPYVYDHKKGTGNYPVPFGFLFVFYRAVCHVLQKLIAIVAGFFKLALQLLGNLRGYRLELCIAIFSSEEITQSAIRSF